MSQAEPVQIAPHDWTRKGQVVFVRCPSCDVYMTLDHDVDVEGKISPSLDCPLCDFHDWGQLVGWAGGPVS